MDVKGLMPVRAIDVFHEANVSTQVLGTILARRLSQTADSIVTSVVGMVNRWCADIDV
jgi:hypothetical protein